MRNQLAVVTICACTVALYACTSLPPPEIAPIVAPARFKEADTSNSTVHSPDAPWWTLYRDAELDALQQRALAENASIRQVLAQLRSAKAAAEASHSNGWPTASVALSANRAETSATTQLKAGPINTVALNSSASWELDLWGRLANAGEAADAAVQASEADLAAARLSVQATLTQLYLTVRASDIQRGLLERTLQATRHIVDLTQARLDAGVAPVSELLQAQTQFRNTENQWRDVVTQRAQTEHALASLLGVTPTDFALDNRTSLPTAPALPAALPSTLLERRPDLRAGRARLQAALAQIGVTDAALFPTLTLNASASLSHSSVASLLASPNSAWSLGTNLAQALFDGGTRRQAATQARANAELVGANYKQQVLTALQEVEDNLIAAHQLQEEVTSQEATLRAAQRGLELLSEQSRAGTASGLQVQAARITALNAEIALNTLNLRRLLATNTLLKNLAGTW